MRLRERAVVVLVALALVAGGPAPIGTAQPAGPPGTPGDQTAEVARLKDEIERLKGMVPDRSHVMKDVAYHFSNLWFAG